MPTDRFRPQDRRVEPRHKAHGPVILHPGSGAPAFTGRLVDLAKSGFRARHELQTLRPGAEVAFEIAGYPGRARVVWTRILGQSVESGFLILPGDGA